MLQKIKNRNVTGKMCNEELCDKDSVNYIEIELANMIVLVQLCEKHSLEYEKWLERV